VHTDILRRLSNAVRRKHPEKRRTNGWFLFHNNAPAHQSILVNDFLAKNNVTTLEHLCTLLTWLQLIFTCSLDWNRPKGTGLLWCYWHHWGCKGWAEKAFRKWLPGMYPTTLQSL